MAPQGLGSLLTRGPLGTLIDRIGPRPVVLAGTALTALGTLAYTQAGPHTSELLLAVSLVVRGAGVRPCVLVVTGLHRTRRGPRAPTAPRPP